MKALVLIDLQNEFLDPEGNFPINESSKAVLISNLTDLVPAFRQQPGEKQLIIWVRSEYGPLSPRDVNERDEEDIKDHFLDGTHSGKTPCCAPGSNGAEFYHAARSLIDESRDTIVTKRWFSAFKETSLADTLIANGLKDVYFAGLLSNICVLASVTSSAKLHAQNWRTHVVKDCLGFRREKSHSTALAKMQELNVSFVCHSDFSAAPALAPAVPISRPKLYYVNGSIPSWRVMIALHEKGIDTEMIRMRVMSVPKPTRQPDFLAINPRGKTPVLIDSDPAQTKINESLAILYYLEDYYPNPPLLPAREDRGKRTRVLSLMQESENLHNTYDALEDAYWDGKRNDTFAMFVDKIRPRLIADIESELEFWETYLKSYARNIQSQDEHVQRDIFIAGTEDFTLADCAFYPLVAYMVHRGFKFGEKWPMLERYYRTLSEKECAKKALPEGWEKRGKANVFYGGK